MRLAVSYLDSVLKGLQSAAHKSSRRRAEGQAMQRAVLEALEPRQLLTSLAIDGAFTSATNFSLNLYTDDSTLAANGTIAINWGDGTGDVV